MRSKIADVVSLHASGWVLEKEDAVLKTKHWGLQNASDCWGCPQRKRIICVSWSFASVMRRKQTLIDNLDVWNASPPLKMLLDINKWEICVSGHFLNSQPRAFISCHSGVHSIH
jgi:hypothetical protein